MNRDTLVLTPTLGRRPSLSSTILSVYQVYPRRIRHVLVGPEDVLCTYKKQFPWVTILDDQSSGSIYSALNYALSVFTDYRLFAYINDDDEWLPGFSKIFDFLDNNPHYVYAVGRVLMKDSDAGSFFPASSFPIPALFPDYLRLNIPIFTQQSLLIRRLALEYYADKFNTDMPISADSVMWADIASTFRGKFIPILASVYEISGNRLSKDASLISVDRLSLTGCKPPKANLFLRALLIIFFRLYNIPIYVSRCIYSLRLRI